MPILYGGISEINDWNPIGDEFQLYFVEQFDKPKVLAIE